MVKGCQEAAISNLTTKIAAGYSVDNKYEVQWGKRVFSWSEIRQFLPLALPAPLHLVLIRHGESEANARGLITGQWDVDLTSKGRRQAIELGQGLAGSYDVVVSSHLRRSRETLSLCLNGADIDFRWRITDPRVAECRLGKLEGEKRRPLEYYALGQIDKAPPGGETYIELTQRVVSFLIDICLTAQAEDRGLHVLVSTHAGPMRVLAGVLTRIESTVELLRLAFPNAEPVRFTTEEIPWPAYLENGGPKRESGVLSERTA